MSNRAQEPSPRIVENRRHYYVPVETHLIPSRFVAQTFRVQVMQPLRCGQQVARLPVVYTTDGNFQFDVLKGLAYSLQAAPPDAPQFMLVGIGYPGDSPFVGSVLRARDLTFPRYPRLNVQPMAADAAVVDKGAKDFYGAEDFQCFIREELIPFIDSTYPTLPSRRAYFGHSGGGGFGLFTLFTDARLFDSYVISSPGLTYHGVSSAGVRYENYDFMFEYARNFIASTKGVDDVALYMSVGAEEEFEPELTHWQLTSSFYRMAALMKAAAIPGLQVTAEVFPGEKHMTAWPISFAHGMRNIFQRGTWRGGAGAVDLGQAPLTDRSKRDDARVTPPTQ